MLSVQCACVAHYIVVAAATTSACGWIYLIFSIFFSLFHFSRDTFIYLSFNFFILQTHIEHDACVGHTEKMKNYISFEIICFLIFWYLNFFLCFLFHNLFFVSAISGCFVVCQINIMKLTCQKKEFNSIFRRKNEEKSYDKIIQTYLDVWHFTYDEKFTLCILLFLLMKYCCVHIAFIHVFIFILRFKHNSVCVRIVYSRNTWMRNFCEKP